MGLCESSPLLSPPDLLEGDLVEREADSSEAIPTDRVRFEYTMERGVNFQKHNNDIITEALIYTSLFDLTVKTDIYKNTQKNLSQHNRTSMNNTHPPSPQQPVQSEPPRHSESCQGHRGAGPV